MLVIDDDLRERIHAAALHRIKVDRAAGLDEAAIRRSEHDLVGQVLGQANLDVDSHKIMLRAVQEAIDAAIEATREPMP